MTILCHLHLPLLFHLHLPLLFHLHLHLQVIEKVTDELSYWPKDIKLFSRCEHFSL